jgi:phosphohistidine swiveling domain-containing protein
MMHKRAYVFSLRHRSNRNGQGNKVSQLRYLSTLGLPVPATYVCQAAACALYRTGEREIISAIRDEIEHTLDPDRAYAVRSSATVEDGAQHSFAGQFSTHLDVRGMDRVLQAIISVWENANGDGLRAYRQRTDQEEAPLGMAVMVQEMVPATLSGVVFTRNPVTGMNETVIECIPGLGEALAQRGVTPQRFVQKWGQWIEVPNGTTPPAILENVARQAQIVANRFDRPLDLEWAYDGQTLYWLQMRPITSLESARVYSNRMSREMIPGAIKPAVWSVTIPMFSELKRRLLTEILGRHSLDPHSLVRAFYHHAYFDMNALGNTLEAFGLPRDAHELMLGIEVPGGERPSFNPSWRTYRLLPRVLAFAGRQLWLDHRLRAYLPQLETRLTALEGENLTQADSSALLASIAALSTLMYEAEYQHVLVYLLLHLHQHILEMMLRRRGLDPTRYTGETGGIAEQQRYTPTPALSALHDMYRRLGAADRELVANGDVDALAASPGAASFWDAFSSFLARFWHLRDRTADLSAPCWRETPELVLQTIAGLDGPTSYGTPSHAAECTLDINAGRLLRKVSARTQAYRLHRDALGYYYSWMNGLLRQRFLHLGERLVANGCLERPEQVFFLYLEETEDLVRGREPEIGGAALAQQRAQEIDLAERLTLPSIIYGEAPVLSDVTTATMLKGVGASSGSHTGQVRHVKSVRDLPRVVPGDVLVIPYSDVALTPLYARASAIVSSAGGLLAHSAIVAREFGIPCVVSVEGAEGLPEDTIVTVDGSAGQVLVLEMPER